MTTPTTAHKDRIKSELKNVGVTAYGLMKQESRFLPQIIHHDEHIMGVVYGRYPDGSAMLIATDLRVIFLDRKPLFTLSDEIHYDVISGISHHVNSGFAAVTLHSKLGNYELHYVNLRCAEIFVKYIEKTCIERSVGIKINANNKSSKQTASETINRVILDKESFDFLRSHEIAVLSTISRTGGLHGSTVYFTLADNPASPLFVLTKADTNKALNSFANPIVALTAYDEQLQQTVQLQCRAEIEHDQTLANSVFNDIVHLRGINGKATLPPVTKLDKGAYVVLKLYPVFAVFNDFNRKASE